MGGAMENPGDVKIRLTTEDDGVMWATVEEMPGVFATGHTLDELRESLEEGIALYLADEDRPAPTVRLGEFHDGAQVTETRADLAFA
jgi:predicted RNase H-like HicB family nuclease